MSAVDEARANMVGAAVGTDGGDAWRVVVEHYADALIAAVRAERGDAIKAAAAGCHHERWDSDWQDGHTTLRWEDCTAWPCNELRAALEQNAKAWTQVKTDLQP